MSSITCFLTAESPKQMRVAYPWLTHPYTARHIHAPQHGALLFSAIKDSFHFFPPTLISGSASLWIIHQSIDDNTWAAFTCPWHQPNNSCPCSPHLCLFQHSVRFFTTAATYNRALWLDGIWLLGKRGGVRWWWGCTKGPISGMNHPHFLISLLLGLHWQLFPVGSWRHWAAPEGMVYQEQDHCWL